MARYASSGNGLAVTVLALATLLACRSGPTQPPTQWKVGGLYSIESGEGDFSVAKVLALDPGVVGVRVYKQRFPARPAKAPSTLTLGTINDKDGFGIGHLPLAEEEFGSWKPQLLEVQTVTAEELEGYSMWKESQGGS